jgi:hypothetical protein
VVPVGLDGMGIKEETLNWQEIEGTGYRLSFQAISLL